jgi:7,8-dihydroneopterin aldolase/epimerase/oxygenase
MSAVYAIILREHALMVRIGIHDFERQGPQRLLVTAAVAMARKSDGDAIGHVVDYDYLREEAATLAGERHYELQESFCEALIARCRQRAGVLGVAVLTQKPDVYPDCRAVGCLMAWIGEPSRGEVERLFAMLNL